MKKVAILQSNYIPWKGYFDIIASVDLFIFHDDLQFTKNDWRNRNKIITENGPQWLTIPCGTSEKRLICEVQLNDYSWQKKHYNLLLSNYKKAPYFNLYSDLLSSIYLDQQWKNLSELNQYIIKRISTEVLGLEAEFADSRSFNLQEKKEKRVLELLKKASADEYLSGPAAKSYINEESFEKENIKLEWMNYSGYPDYKQQFGDSCEHAVSIFDLMFNTGSEIKNYMLSTFTKKSSAQ